MVNKCQIFIVEFLASPFHRKSDTPNLMQLQSLVSSWRPTRADSRFDLIFWRNSELISAYDVMKRGATWNRDRSAGMIAVRSIAMGLTFILASAFYTEPMNANDSIDYEALANHIIRALKLAPGERVLIRFDPGYFNQLVAPLRRMIRNAKAIDLAAIEYVETTANDPQRPPEPAELEARELAFEKLLENIEVYLWLPLRDRERQLPAPEARALARWLDGGGSRREIHFHWSAGSVLADGLAGSHRPEMDRVYRDALDIDYKSLDAAQDGAIDLLRSGNVRVRTPEGTDLSFRVGDRPFNKQNGDASPERMLHARVRVDREIELPAGVLRVAPLEETASGTIFIPSARFGSQTARNIRLTIVRGAVARIEASENLAVVESELNAGGDAAHRFREFGLGFNHKLASLPGASELSYFGYGAGVVRLSLGDNQELGGRVRGNFTRWFFFPNATVEVDRKALVLDGKLMPTEK